jgi:hypothetical protein
MPSNKVKQSETRKAAGTRIGILSNWREGSTKSSKTRHGHTIRDGR